MSQVRKPWTLAPGRRTSPRPLFPQQEGAEHPNACCHHDGLPRLGTYGLFQAVLDGSDLLAALSQPFQGVDIL
jgi:hypothetical protein